MAFCAGQIVVLSFVFMHIPGGSFIFDIPLCDFCPPFASARVSPTSQRDNAELRPPHPPQDGWGGRGNKTRAAFRVRPHLCFQPAV